MNRSKVLEKSVRELVRIFRAAPSPHHAHERSRQVLRDLSGSKASLNAALELEIRRPGGLSTRNFPAIGITIVNTPYFGLVANCFLPGLPGEAGVTANSIHHHGHMLLTTVTTFGPGYEHWRFTTPKLIDAEREVFSMKLLDREQHSVDHVAFVDEFIPHAVVVPPSLTVTFALWSSRHKVTWREHVKRLPLIRGREHVLRRVATRLGLAKRLAINTVRYFDYYPVREGFKGMKDRVQFERGPNADFLCSLFHVLQTTNNEDLARVIEERTRVGERVDNPDTLVRLLADLRAGRPISSRLSEGIHRLEHMNFSTSAIERTLAALDATSTTGYSASA